VLFPALHELVVHLSVFLAAGAGVLSLLSAKEARSTATVVLGAGFLAAAGLEYGHGPLFDILLPVSRHADTDVTVLRVAFGYAARMFAAGALCVASCVSWTTLPSAGRRGILFVSATALGVFFALSLVGLVGWSHQSHLILHFEVVRWGMLCLTLIFSASACLRFFPLSRRSVEAPALLLSAAALFGALEAIAFVLARERGDPSHVVAHVYGLIAFGLVTAGVFWVGLRLPYLRLEAADQHIATEHVLIELARRQWVEAFDAVDDPILLHDASGRILRSNRAYLRRVGLSAEEVEGRDYRELFPRSRGGMGEEAAPSWNGAPRVVEVVEPTGEVFISREFCVFEDDGYQYSVHLFRDVTAERAALGLLRQSEERFRQMAENARDIIFRYRLLPTRGLEYVNTATTRILGRTPQELYGDPDFFAQLVHPDDLKLLEQDHAAGADPARPMLLRVHRRDGTVAWFDQQTVPVLDSGGKTIALDGISRDVTEFIEARERLSLWSQVLTSATEGVLVLNADLHVQLVNPSFERMTGFSEAELKGASPKPLRSSRHDVGFLRGILKNIRSAGGWQGEVWLQRKDGSSFPTWHSVSTVTNEAGAITHFVSLCSDITERRAAEEQIRHLAHFDVLTGLPNRLLFEAHAERALKWAEQKVTGAAILFLDIDHFKTINDSLGHEVGDRLLEQLAVRFKRVVRATDTVARLGGDEFIVLLPDVETVETALMVGEKLLACVREPLYVDEHELLVTGSVGAALYPEHGKDLTTLRRNADAAMYQAKDDGRDCVRIFTTEMGVRAVEAHSIETQLRRAIEKRELSVYYQPQVDLTSGRIVGAEALVRWNHPEQGMISPARFIPIAEERGLIGALGELVLTEACQEWRKWRDAGFEDLTVAVNVSAVQFRQMHIEECVKRVLAQSGIPVDALELEITESVVMREAEAVIHTMQSLKDWGVKLSIDDFGTGFSSLSYLRRFPISKLKVDQSFVREMTRSEDAARIVAAIVGLAKSLRLRVIAEGVETDSELALLQELGCDEMQGYLVSRPLPAPEFQELLRRHLTMARSA
jgi:diguanylate cyclase (GGDEF)-like protein/PAS domain S-box-containing protein